MEINVSSNIELTEDTKKYIGYLSETIDGLYEYFNLPIELNVEVVESIDFREIQGEYAFAGMHYDDNVYYIKLAKEVFTLYTKQCYGYIEGALYHEFLHIYDLYNILRCCNIKLNSNRWDSPKDYITNMGYTFWTEFFAYMKTFKYYKDYFNYNTRFQMVNRLKKLIDISYDLMDKGIEDGINKFKSFHNNIDGFIYLLAKHMAGCAFGKSKNYLYCKKTKKQMEFKYIDKLLNKLIHYVIEIDDNRNNKKMKNSIYKLGNYLYKKYTIH